MSRKVETEIDRFMLRNGYVFPSARSLVGGLSWSCQGLCCFGFCLATSLNHWFLILYLVLRLCSNLLVGFFNVPALPSALGLSCSPSGTLAAPPAVYCAYLLLSACRPGSGNWRRGILYWPCLSVRQALPLWLSGLGLLGVTSPPSMRRGLRTGPR